MYTTEEGKQKQIAYVKAWRLRNPGKHLIYKNRWKARNKDKVLAASKRYALKHSEKVAELRKKWAKANPEKVKAYQQRRRNTVQGKYYKYRNSAKSRGYDFTISRTDFTALLSGARCFYCDSSEKLGLDRVDNARGYHKENVVPACWPCNRLKFTMSKDRFLKLCIAIAQNCAG